ncbi:RHS repeat domain-containing protein, partial [Porphyromonas gulae]
TDYLGTPTEMYNSDGEKTWSAELDIYGSVRTFAGRSLSDCPFRYQGQYEDEETGLYYNRFRYYSPDEGRYISQDPIGLAGGIALYGYVHDSNSWIDPLGLAPWEKGGFNNWFNNASVQDILDNKKAVEAALRAPGGKHEMFPVSIAHKAKELGFTAEEIKSMSVDTGKITFVDVPDDLGNLLEGKHHASSASSFFHNRLIEDLNKAKTKPEAMDIIKKHHDAHMKVSNH